MKQCKDCTKGFICLKDFGYIGNTIRAACTQAKWYYTRKWWKFWRPK